MSRFGAGDRILVKPQNNVYTVLAIIGAVATASALIILFMRSSSEGISLF
jgi:hypothetical protein